MKNKSCPKCGNKITSLRRRFVVEVRDGAGKKHVKSLGNVTLDEAKTIEVQHKSEIKSEVINKTTIRSICVAYVQKLKSLDRVYVNDVDYRLNVMCKHFGYDADINSVTVQGIDSFRGKLLDSGLAKATIDRYFAAARAAWNYSVDGSNPWKKAGMFNPDNKITRYLTNEERGRLLDACLQVSRQLYEIVFVALGTGLRKTEILELRRNQIDFEHGSISVIAKGNRSRLLYPADSVMRLLQDIPDNGSEFVWVDNEGRPHKKDWRYPWNKALRLAGVSSDFRFHDLRHDAATRAYSASNDIYLVSQMLGHSEIGVTLRYAHMDKKKVQKAFNIIDPGTSRGNMDE